MNESERQKRVAALLREREGYVQSGKEDRIKQVDDQLRVYGYKRQLTSEEARKVPPQGRSERPVDNTVKKND